MQGYALFPHPDHPPLAVRGVAVEVRGGRDDLLLTYRVDGGDNLVVPVWQTPARADGLWRTTCFELFLMLDDEERYVELNFSSSTQWAAWSFEGYREGRADWPFAVPPHVERVRDGIAVACDLAGLPHGELLMGLSAVIEEKGGRLSYWALAHPPGAPDFHHRACFAARLPAAG